MTLYRAVRVSFVFVVLVAFVVVVLVASVVAEAGIAVALMLPNAQKSVPGNTRPSVSGCVGTPLFEGTDLRDKMVRIDCSVVIDIQGEFHGIAAQPNPV
jgi:hypothetical protein